MYLAARWRLGLEVFRGFHVLRFCMYVCMYVLRALLTFVPFTLKLRGRFLVGLEGELC